MARALRTKTNVKPPDGDFTFGRIKDNPGDNTGTPVNELLYGDMHQFFEKLMLDGGIVFNGLPDQGYTGYQLNQALDAVIGLKTKIFTIGDWNMDLNGTLVIAHGLTMANIREISAMIIIDGSAVMTPLHSSDPGGGGGLGGGYQLSVTNITLIRTIGGFFDSVNYDATSFNRGYVVVRYTS